MARNLKNLIKASGYAGTSGQSFRNHVAGAASGVKMSDYNMGNPAWTNTPNPSTTYATPTTFSNLTLTLGVYNAKASQIQETTTASWQVAYISPLSTASATLNSVSWASNVATVSITVNGELTTGTPTTTASVWYQGYTYPYLPYGGSGNTDPNTCSPDCETAFNVSFTMSANPVAASGSTTNNLSVQYVPDKYGAQYNPTIWGPGPTAGGTWTVNQDRRPGAQPTVDAVQWATDASFTNVVSTSQTYTISSDNNNYTELYLRYKLDGAGSWTDYPSNPLVWQDPRNDT